MISWLLALVVGGAATVLAYPRATLHGTLSRVAAALRAIAVTLIAGLGLNVAFGGARTPQPLVALDVSASWLRGGDSARYQAARRAAVALARDSVLAFGDSIRRATEGTPPGDAASRLRDVAERAVAAGRPLVVFTDGELDDTELLDGLPTGSRVEVSEADTVRDVAITEVRAPRVASDGDTVEARVTIAAGGAGARAGRLTLTLDGRPVAAASIDSLGAYGERSIALRFVAPPVPQGARGNRDRELRASIVSEGDRDARNNEAATSIDVGSTSAAVLVSTAPDLDARELAALLRGTAALPTRVYYRVAPGQWREDMALSPVNEEVVRRAVREAALVILHGDTALFGAPRTVSRGALALVVPAEAGAGEWFATGAPLSPVSTLLAGTAWDSLPPLEVSATVPNADFELLETRRARRLDRRVAMVGWEQPRRVVVAAASGFWRWRFRGGAGADAFTSVWGSTIDWLAGERPDVRAAVPELASAREGAPVRWRRGSAADSTVRVVLRKRGDTPVADTLMLRFGATNVTMDSRALPSGVYDVETGGGASLLVVNPSGELLPRRPTVRSGTFGAATATAQRRRSREMPWLFALAVAALCVEWVLRRRAGLR
jgi:hypothetical protein